MKAVFVAVILCSMILGIFFAPYFNVSSLSLFALFGIFFILSISLVPQKWLWLSMIAIGFFFFGVLRFQEYDAKFQNVVYPKDKTVKIEGRVVDAPEETDKSTKVVVFDKAKNVKIQLILRPFAGIKYSDNLNIEGKISEPEAESIKNNLLSKGIVAQMLFPKVNEMKIRQSFNPETAVKGLLYDLRSRFETKINSLFPEPEGSFLAGLLLGVKRNLPDWFLRDLQNSSTTHLIALSGYNITVIIEGLRLIFSRRSAKLSFFVPLAAILGFVVMTGSQASVARAGIMGAVMMLAYRVGRQSSSLMAIALTAGVMVFLNPYILRFDLGFQLSFAAFIGIIYLKPVIDKILPAKIGSAKEILSTTIGAQLMAFPIILYNFGNFSAISLLANLVVLPFIPFVMLIGFVSVCLGMILPQLAILISWTTILALKAIIFLIHFFANLPYASFSGIAISGLSLAFYYILLFELVFIFKWARRLRLGGK